MESIADILITKGWVQGQSHGNHGERCLGAAIGEACRNTGNIERVRAITRRVIGYVFIHEWNDNPYRTFDEVLRVAKEVDELMAKESDH